MKITRKQLRKIIQEEVDFDLGRLPEADGAEQEPEEREHLPSEEEINSLIRQVESLVEPVFKRAFKGGKPRASDEQLGKGGLKRLEKFKSKHAPHFDAFVAHKLILLRVLALRLKVGKIATKARGKDATREDRPPYRAPGTVGRGAPPDANAEAERASRAAHPYASTPDREKRP